MNSHSKVCVYDLSSVRTAGMQPVVTSVPGLYLLGSAHVVNGTLNVNESVRLAETHVERILR